MVAYFELIQQVEKGGVTLYLRLRIFRFLPLLRNCPVKSYALKAVDSYGIHNSATRRKEH